jgi:hypothetical protein
MALGKMERFWKNILEEFLLQAQFGSFEGARERIRLWVQYYNHQRPHQGIEGLCPADRFFEIHHELKKTLEQGMEENALELALRGKLRNPFYMVGLFGMGSGQAITLEYLNYRLKKKRFLRAISLFLMPKLRLFIHKKCSAPYEKLLFTPPK